MPQLPRFAWLPMPWQSALLFIVWLLLNNTLALGTVLLGGVLALVIPWLVHGLQAAQPSIKRPGLAVGYVLRVLYDIITANMQVALLVLGSTERLQPAFIAFPVDLRDPLPLTLLAGTISLTPGTVSCEFSVDQRWLYIHALHVEDQQALIDSIKARYEHPLKEIFAC